MGFPVQITKRCSTLHSGDPALRIDKNSLRARKINHDPIIAKRPSGHIVATTTYRDQQFISAGKVHGSDYIGCTRAMRDESGALINAGIPDLPGCLIINIVRSDQLSPKCSPKLFDEIMTYYYAFGVSKITWY